MTELKTLKDLQKYEDDGLDCNIQEIREEAIKWVKQDIEDVCDWDTLIERWMHRFNLVNEDVFGPFEDLQ